MLQFYLTEYIKDGVTQDGPLICANNLNEANAQAQDLNLKLVGELFPLIDLLEVERVH
jgi:hypothetical protein|tara:strand:- start:1200 stop:1373 length:174 start_codon:yes stop_codon:yes gene_type:complete